LAAAASSGTVSTGGSGSQNEAMNPATRTTVGRTGSQGSRIEPKIAKTTNLLVFEIPEDLFPPKSFEPITIDLHVFHEIRRWLVSKSLQERRFHLSVFAAPPAVGTVTLYGSEEIEEITKTSVQTRELGCHAEHCRRCDGSERIEISEPDTYMVLESPRWNEGYHTDQWGAGIRDVSPKGFTVWWWATSYGCGPLWSGTRGQVRGSVSYEVEKRTKRQVDTVLAENRKIEWGNDFRLSTTGKKLLTVTAVMNTMLGGTEAVRPGEKGRFFILDFDRVAGELLVRPRDLEEVLQRP
jgi:hypothetical protein